MLFSQKLGPLAGPSFCNHLQLQAKQPITAVTSQLPVEIPSEIRLKNMPKKRENTYMHAFLGESIGVKMPIRVLTIQPLGVSFGINFGLLGFQRLHPSGWHLHSPMSESPATLAANVAQIVGGLNLKDPCPSHFANSTLNHKYTNFYFNGHLAKTSNTVLEVQLLKHMSLKSI